MKISSLLMRLIRRLKLNMTIRSRTVKIYRVPISGTELSSIPEDERVFFIQAARLANDLSFLHKLLYFASGKSEVEEEQRGLFTQHIFVVRILAGTLFEGWDVFRKSFFNKLEPENESSIAKRYEPLLKESVKSDLQELKQYFNRNNNNNIIKKIRNQFAYHYDKNKIREELSSVRSESHYDIYLAKAHGNSLYGIAQEITGQALFGLIKDIEKVDNNKKAYERLLSDILSVSEKFLHVIGNCLRLIVERHLGQEFENAKAIDVGEPAKLGDIRLPFFVEPPAK